MAQKTTLPLSGILGATALLALLAGSVLVLPTWLKNRQTSGNGIETVTVEATQCDVNQQTCTARWPDGETLTLNLLPRPIPLVKTLQVEVRVSDKLTGQLDGPLQLDFNGTDMDMGINQSRLVASGEPGHYQGKGMLPVCVTGKMRWQAEVLLSGPSGPMRKAVFRFESGGTGH